MNMKIYLLVLLVFVVIDATMAKKGSGSKWKRKKRALPSYKTLGCFKDTGNRAIPTLEGKDPLLDGSYQARQNAVEKCYQAAKKRGFKVFAVQHGGWCASSETAEQTYDKYGPSSSCGSDGEGGGWANQVYEIQALPSLLQSLGCFKDTGNRAIATLERKDPLLDGNYQARQNAVEKCYQAAKKRGFKVFAVQHGGWCASSETAEQTYNKYGPSSSCGSDGEGGGWANQVYEIQALPSYQTLGCFKDTSNRAILILEGKDQLLDGGYQARQNAIEKCYQAAKKRGFKVFSVQHGGQCFSSATAEQTYDKYGKSSSCGSDGEGGFWANQVYDIEDKPSLLQNLGCFKDTGNRAIPTLEGKDPLLDGSYQARRVAVEKCYQAAKKRGFKVFAVQHGGWCASSATAGQTYKKYGPSSSCRPDGEGGPWANQVYEIQG